MIIVISITLVIVVLKVADLVNVACTYLIAVVIVFFPFDDLNLVIFWVCCNIIVLSCIGRLVIEAAVTL